MFVLLAFLQVSLYCQNTSDEQKARDLISQAVELMDNGKIDQSLELLKDARKLDRDSWIIPYEMGYAYLLDENYKKAVKVYKKVVKMDSATDQCYQMLGNAWDFAGNRKKAFEAYEEGLEKFPNSGRLYLEMGVMYHNSDWNTALAYHEKGIAVDPAYPSNYYWAARIFCNSTEEVWGMIYGEIFMNIERTTKRTEEISKLLYDTYKSEIRFHSDTSMSISFCKQMSIDPDAGADQVPFGMIYEHAIMQSVLFVYDTITLATLDGIRHRFIDIYYDSGLGETWPNALFDWQKELIGMTYFEAYNYWLLMAGNQEEFQVWYEDHHEYFDDFLGWFQENPMPVSREHYFYRELYE